MEMKYALKDSMSKVKLVIQHKEDILGKKLNIYICMFIFLAGVTTTTFGES